MKRYVGLILAIGFAIVGITMAFNQYKAKSTEAARDANFARIKLEYLERVGWIRSIPDEKSYRDEVQTFLRWYFSEINEHLNKFQGNKKFDGYLSELGKRGVSEAQLAEKKAYFEYTKRVFDLLREGNYNPAWTSSDKGMRLDIVSIKPMVSAGNAVIRFPIVLWGAQRVMREDGKLKKMMTSANFNITWKLLDEKGKLLGEVNVAGDPTMKVDFPERMIPEFPAQMVLGHYDFEPVPANAKNAEITFSVTSRSATGGEAFANFVWKVPVPPEWKLRPGEEWKGATESVRSQEEIDGKQAKY